MVSFISTEVCIASPYHPCTDMFAVKFKQWVKSNYPLTLVLPPCSWDEILKEIDKLTLVNRYNGKTAKYYRASEIVEGKAWRGFRRQQEAEVIEYSQPRPCCERKALGGTYSSTRRNLQSRGGSSESQDRPGTTIHFTAATCKLH